MPGPAAVERRSCPCIIWFVPENPLTPQHQPGPLPPFFGRQAPPKPKEPPRYGRWVAVGVTLSFVAALVLLAVLVPRAHRASVAKLKAEVLALTQAAEPSFHPSAYEVK